jgi:hypothetical protein
MIVSYHQTFRRKIGKMGILLAVGLGFKVKGLEASIVLGFGS